MAVPSAAWPLLGLLWILTVPSVHCRGDAFQTEEMPEKDLSETPTHWDDILDINQELILLEEPEKSFLIEGDIVRMSPFRMFPFADPQWPKKGGFVHVPYIISYKYDKSSMERILEAFLDFEKFTCIKFVPYSSERDFISITPLSGCFSSVGRTGGMQVVSLAPACLRRGRGVALHQLMHVLGFGHEHSRVDRDKYISISWDEILPGLKMNFMKSKTTNTLVDYDYSSVLHYRRTAFSLRGFPTMVPLSGSCPDLGQSWNLSRSDIARVNRLYRCWGAAAQPVATEQTIEGTVTDFLPSESVHYWPTSKDGLLTARSPVAPTGVAHPSMESLQHVDTSPPFSAATEEDFRATEVRSRTAAPRTGAHDWHVVSPETSSRTEVGGQHLPEGVLHSTTESTVSQSRASTAKQPQHYEAYTQSSQKNTEERRPIAPEMAHTASSLPTSPESLTTDVANGTAGRPTKSALQWLLSGSRTVYRGKTEPPTSIVVGSDGTGSLNLTEGHSVPVTETTSEEQELAFHTSVGQTGGEDGDHVDMYWVGVGAEATTAPYVTPSLKASGKPTMGLGRDEDIDASVHAGAEVPEDTETSLWSDLPTASSGAARTLLLTEETSPGWKAKESGSILQAIETVSTPSQKLSPLTWMSNSGNLGEENEMDHYTASSSVPQSELSKLLRSSPESVATNQGRTAAVTHDSETVKEGTFSDGRPTASTRVPKEVAREGPDWATTQVDFTTALLEVGSPTYITSLGVTKGRTQPHKTESLGTPSEGSASNQTSGELLSPLSSPVGITTAPQTYTAPLKALENTTVAAPDGRSGRSTALQESREPFLGIVGAKLPKETHRSASQKVHLQGTAWSMPEMRGEATITEGMSPILESGGQVTGDADATDGPSGDKKSTAKSAEITKVATISIGPFLSRYIKGLGEKGVPSSADPSSEQTSP